MPHRSATTTRLLLRSLAVCASLVLLAGPSTAAADPSGPTPVPDGTSSAERRAAETALDRVARALEGRDDREAEPSAPRDDLTLQLRDLRLSLPDLSAADAARARALLARPTTGQPFWESKYESPEEVLSDCEVPRSPATNVCVHWVPASVEPDNAPAATDSDHNGVPDYVDTVRVELDNVWGRIVTDGGYKAPLPDAGGPDDRLDVYLMDIGDEALYGYCSSEKFAAGHTAPGYCVLDNDYSKLQYEEQTPIDNLRVTAAHEFFHAVQFAYDALEDPWLMEGTAAWVEDEVYDEIDDNIQFTVGGPMTNPRVPLDAAGFGNAGWYTAWTWWRYLSEVRFPDTGATGMPLIIRNIWERATAAGSGDRHSLQATVAAIAARGSSFTTLLADYGEAKRHPGQVFEEGAPDGTHPGYPTVPRIALYTLAAGAGTTTKTATLPHLSSQTFVFVPGARTTSPSWRLRIPVDAPDLARGSQVQVSVVRKDGTRPVRTVRLNARGVGSVITDFSTSTVTRVELTITNAGRRYTCWRGTDLACQGRSLDNGLQTKFRGITFRA